MQLRTNLPHRDLGNKPKGQADYVEQEGLFFCWSESNCHYEYAWWLYMDLAKAEPAALIHREKILRDRPFMRVLNKYIHQSEVTSHTVNIMRPNEMGNPFVVGKDGNRNDVCDKFADYFDKRVKRDHAFRLAVNQLAGHDLLCCCRPRRCHGDHIVAAIIRLSQEKWR